MINNLPLTCPIFPYNARVSCLNTVDGKTSINMKYTFTLISLFIVMGVKAQTIYYVDSSRADNSGAGTSWETAKKDVQEALDIAPIGSGVWIKRGTYYPTKDPFGNASPTNSKNKTFFLRDSVAIYGGFAGTETLLSQRNVSAYRTVLSGDFNHDDSVSGAGPSLVIAGTAENAYHLLVHASSYGTIVDGLTITGGNATNSGNFIIVNGMAVNNNYGGGLFSGNNSGKQIVVNNCTFSFNTTGQPGAAAGAYISSNGVVSDCIFSFNAGQNGGGLVISDRLVSVINNRFEHNRAVFGGGLVCRFIASTTVSNCFFFDNAGMGGGAYLYGPGNKSVFTSCIFQGNTGIGSAGGITVTLSASAKIHASAFINNKGMGLGHSVLASQGDDTMTLDGCIFTNNTPASDDEIQLRSGINIISNCSVVGKVNVFPAAVSTVRFRNNILTSITNYSALSSNNLLGGNPLYVNAANPAGADSIYFTPDDGLRLQCGSPAINAGSDTATITDIIGTARVGKPDIGAYEATDTISVITAISSSARAFQSNVTVYGDCDHTIAWVTASGAAPITDSTTAKVWVEAGTPATWVKRHYEITPDNNAATATGRVTLFFTQEEFDAFNALNITKLPTGSLDAAGKANLLIEKRPGTSINGSGLPLTYNGTPVTTNPADNDIVWNNQLSRWEVTVNVTGFSGFFVKTVEAPLPVTWLSISGRLNAHQNAVISWQVAERSVANYDVEVSSDAGEFSRIGRIPGKGDGENRYSFTAPNSHTGNNYYRIRQADIDGEYSYSSIVNVSAGAPVTAILYPNPAIRAVILKTGPKLMNTPAQLVDMNGKMVRQWVIHAQESSVDLSGLSSGIYLLQFNDGQVLRITKH